MKLVVDIGNSRMKWTEVDGGSWRSGRSEALAADFGPLLDRHWGEMETPSAVLVANVSGDKTAGDLAAWVSGNWALEPGFFRSAERFQNIINEYECPQQLGCDRWAAIIGARALTPHGALCVIDCGTAVTIDAVTADHRFIGGVILPGIDLIQSSLSAGTADIAESREVFKQVFGISTEQCVSGGSFIGSAGAIDRVLSEMHAVLDEPVLYITGGDARSLLPLLSHSPQYEPDLVLIGLAHTLD